MRAVTSESTKAFVDAVTVHGSPSTKIAILATALFQRQGEKIPVPDLIKEAYGTPDGCTTTALDSILERIKRAIHIKGLPFEIRGTRKTKANPVAHRILIPLQRSKAQIEAEVAYATLQEEVKLAGQRYAETLRAIQLRRQLNKR